MVSVRSWTRCARPCARDKRVSRSSSQMVNVSWRVNAASGRAWPGFSTPVSAWCAHAFGSTPSCAPGTTRASGFPAVHRSRSHPMRTRCAPIPWPMSTMTASAVVCAARSRMRRSFVPRSRRSISFKIGTGGIGCCGAAPPSSGVFFPASVARRGRSWRQPSERMHEARPIKLLLAALGGEGGHVLASWLNDAAIASGHYVQGTFIPGVAQRTGATTYYLEIVPAAAARHSAADRRPVLALNAAPGEVDVVVASELLEAARAIQAGFVTPDRTTLIASCARVFTIDEKSIMTDGRLDQQHLRELARSFAQRLIVADYTAVAEHSKSLLNAVLLGALAAAAVLPIAVEEFRHAIRRQGKAVEANLRGFEAGLAAAPAEPEVAPMSGQRQSEGKISGAAAIAEAWLAPFPAEAHAVLAAAVERLTDYQDAAYARLYLERVAGFVSRRGSDGPF